MGAANDLEVGIRQDVVVTKFKYLGVDYPE